MPCRRFESLLAEFGVPYYLKVDIEGHDHLCIEALGGPNLPRYVSIEQGPEATAVVERLSGLGYTGFKCISQFHYLPLQIDRSWSERAHDLTVGLLSSQRVPARLLRAVGFEGALRHWLAGWRRSGGWTFPHGSSGPFGEETRGRWLTLSEFTTTLAHFRALREAGAPSPFWGEKGYSFWADFHARREASADE